jgi:alpha-1,2-mannosyltransferase
VGYYKEREKRYKHFTILGQSLGSALLGLEALIRMPPDVFFGTYCNFGG